MSNSSLFVVAVFGVLALAACGKKETSAETQQDVSAAVTAGESKVSDAVRDANEVASEGRVDVAEASQKAMSNNETENADVALTKAKAAYRVSIEQCESQTGNVRDACKSTAKAVLDAAQAVVDSRRS